MNEKQSNGGRLGAAFYAIGGLVVLGMTILFLRELPAMRRELRIMRM